MLKTYVVYQFYRNEVRSDEDYLSIYCDYYDTENWLDRICSCWQDLYYACMKIEAADLDEVFTIGNFMGATEPTPLRPNLKSVSVGDVIRDKATNRFYVVAPFGFTEIELNVIR